MNHVTLAVCISIVAFCHTALPYLVWKKMNEDNGFVFSWVLLGGLGNASPQFVRVAPVYGRLEAAESVSFLFPMNF